jgi:hypothetical protein
MPIEEPDGPKSRARFGRPIISEVNARYDAGVANAIWRVNVGVVDRWNDVVVDGEITAKVESSDKLSRAPADASEQLARMAARMRRSSDRT